MTDETKQQIRDAYEAAAEVVEIPDDADLSVMPGGRADDLPGG
jgi:hypothetical protein